MKLTDRQVEMFRQDGVIVVEEIVKPADLAPVIREFENWIDERARELQAEGKIADLHEGEPFDLRFASLYAQSQEIEWGMDIMHMRGPATFELLHNEDLLDAVESLIGPEITCNPIQHVRAKPPASLLGENAGVFNVPWHQDSGVTWIEADDSQIVTCWLALLDATVENGCMQVLPGVWKMGHLEHQAEGGTTIRPDLLPYVQAQPVPVRAGGLVFMHRHTPHTATSNFTDRVRWSLDLRYQPTGTPTGRPFHPEFIARSRRDPNSVLTDHAEWSQRWIDALENAQAVQLHRV